MTDHALEITGLRKSYNKGFSLKDVSFSLPRGYVMGLVGPNGAGKTTIIKLIMNLVRRDGGTVRVFGFDNRTEEAEAKARIGFVYDDPDTVFEAQVSDDVAFVLATHNATLCDLVSTHAGSTVTGQSKQELLVGTAGDEQFLVMQLIDRPGNAVGNWAKVECRIKDHRLSSTYSA